jgi:hypothetical protein
VVETGGLENRFTLTGNGGSNPSPSAICEQNCECHARMNSRRVHWMFGWMLLQMARCQHRFLP